MNFKLLTRDQFREGVFARDGHKCVFCDKPAVDAHHIIERRLFDNGGYFLENGASVCAEHHLMCEETRLSVEQVWAAIGVEKGPIPDHLYGDQSYDKWGNPVMANGQRLYGELFFDASVQKVLKQGGFLGDFTHHVKYPRTYHFPWSNPGKDDRTLASLDSFIGQRVIMSEKMDGENTTWYQDYSHARSVNSGSHPARTWSKREWAQRCGDIPERWRVCVENLYAKHSLAYEALPSYIMGYSVWNDHNECLSWDETVQWMQLLEIDIVPVLFDDIWDEKAIRKIGDKLDLTKQEGYVVRVADKFSYGEFRKKVGKYVRKNHVDEDAHHWQRGVITPNKLKGK